eukprot:11268325-Karenia_brevis.AAC.1
MRNVDFDDVETLKDIQRRYCETHPEFSKCSFVIINCLRMGDLDHDKDLRSRTGLHPAATLGVARHVDDYEL